MCAKGVRQMSDVSTVRIDLGERSYDVIVGHGVLDRVHDLLPRGVRRVAIVTQEGIPEKYIPTLSGVSVSRHVIGNGEAFKSLSTIEQLCREFAQQGMTRGDVVVAVGGGMVTDVAGFAAASYHRGIPVIHVATTLLAMIDAAIGGKTGVNIPEGKNLVGAFWQPQAVLCDTETLQTLPPREMRCGLGEVAKYQFLGGEGIDQLDLNEQVAACVAIKAAVVSADEREGGLRAILNYGHTLAHAVESAGGHDLRHGEAVAIGLVFAAELAVRLGRIDEPRVQEHRRVVGAYDLPTSVPANLSTDVLVEFMARDKKALSGLTFVLDGPNGVETVTGVDSELIVEAIAAVRGD